MNTDLESFRTDLAEALTRMSQEEMSRQSGVPQPTISNFVSGRTKAISCDKFLALYPFVYGDRYPADSAAPPTEPVTDCCRLDEETRG